MGEVYLAHDPRLDRPVAIKLILAEDLTDRDRLRRFHQEARAASSLNHPHILVIHDYGEDNGRPFIVTEYVDGQTVRERISDGALAVADAVAIASQTASALAAAHARGIIHRDIKPENVMVRRDGYVKVLDFGLAKLVERPADQREASGEIKSVATVPGTLMGTPRYMSPEQLRCLPPDGRTDVWSVGVMLYEMIAGVLPFVGTTAADEIAAIVHTQPLPIELQAPDVPIALGGILARALEKQPSDRYDAAEFASALATLQRQVDADGGPAGRITVDADLGTSIHTSPVAKRTRVIVLPFRMLRADEEFGLPRFQPGGCRRRDVVESGRGDRAIEHDGRPVCRRRH